MAKNKLPRETLERMIRLTHDPETIRRLWRCP